MGYERDPMLRALSLYRSKKRPLDVRSGLAFLTVAPSSFPWQSVKAFADYFEGASKRAQELGYHLEEIVLDLEKGGKDATKRILRARGIEGIIIAPMPQSNSELEFDWDEFSVVALGFSLRGVKMHRVANHQFRSMVVLTKKLIEKGYKRLALCLPDSIDERVAYGWSGGFLSVVYARLGEIPIPIFRGFGTEISGGSKDQFEAYLALHKPEVIVGTPNLIQPIQDLGYSIPNDVGFSSPAAVSNGEDIAGIDELSTEIGVAAVDFVTSEVEGRRFGIPSVPRQILIEGVWQEGATLI